MSQKTFGIIAAGHQKTAEAGQQMFDEGGNAFDAAIASMLASFVVESTLTSAAGGGFFLAHTKDKRNILFDFFSQTPRYKKPRSDIDFYPIDVNFGTQVQTFHIGMGSIAVPGNIAGVFEVHQKLGKLPFKLVAEPAINYAKNGFEISNFQALCINLLAPILLELPESKKIYAPKGKLLAAGDICFMKDFAATLTELADKGAKEFYQGDIARQLVKDLSAGGYLTLEDLTNYRVITRSPLQINYRGYELVTNPPPSSGGALIGFALKLLEQVDLEKIEFGSAEHLELLAQVMRLTNEGRKDGYDDRIYQDNIADRFLAAEHLQTYQNQLQNTVNKWGSTTHISAIDNEGNAASVTTTNGEGSSYVIPGTGIMLNNMLGEADLNPLGFHNWECDRRISSMMSPTIVLKNGTAELVLGSGGSNRIRTAILQVISNLLDFNLSTETAVKSPRVHWENNIFSVEQPSVIDAIENVILPESTQLVLWQEQNMFFGGVHAVRKTPEGIMEGAGDPRREGVAIDAGERGSNDCYF
ncbi:MAG: gamma-glutamyltransferase [Prochloraceae cyanobacterium]|nr:gamma-glutamyltransferase [Prochloraceae cyanobacterium]